MDDTQARSYITEWRRNADRFERKNRSINRSKCFDGDRQLNVGMAAAWRSCADQLEATLAVVQTPQVDATNMDSPDIPETLPGG